MKKPVVDTKAAHARFGASKSERWMNCPGSIALEEEAPPPVESPWAKEGTEAHAVTEFLLKNRRGFKVPMAAINIARKNHPIDMVEHALTTAEYILHRHMEYEGSEFLCETRVDSSPFTCEGQFGTVDAAVVALFDRLIVVDFKYGAGIAVDPEGTDGKGNPQLVYYALALAYKYDFCFEEVELVVVQPRAWHESGEAVRTHIMTIDELRAWETAFKDGIFDAEIAWELRQMGKQLKNPAVELECRNFESYLAAGKWCRFCPAAVICPVLKEQAIKDAGAVFDDGHLESVPEVLGTKIQNLPALLDAADRLEVWIEKIRDYAFGLLNRGEKIPGYKLVQKKAHRKWNEHAKDLFTDFGYGDLLFCDPKMVTPAEFEKRLGKKNIDPLMKELIDGVTTKDSSGVTMVREDDKRPAHTRNDGSEFDA